MVMQHYVVQNPLEKYQQVVDSYAEVQHMSVSTFTIVHQVAAMEL